MNEFQKPKLNPLIGLLALGHASYEGEKWAKHRKLINPSFHTKKLKLMLPAFGESVTELINKCESKVCERGSSEVDVWPYLISLSADAISRAAFGSSYEEGRRIFELLKEQTELTLRLLQLVYIPGWRKKAMEAGEVSKDNLLGILMDSNFKATQSDENHKKQQLAMSFQHLIDECKLFYFAGQETTSVLLVCTIILLSKHQDWQARAQEEVLAIFGKIHQILIG
ncbi:Cytochrome P450 72A15 [Bienertia sinuspersici]